MSLEIKAVKLLELLNYQKGAVVSREIVRKQAGTVTVFAFDEGQGLSQHSAPFDALAYVVDGLMEIAISGQPFRLSGSEFILMPANQAHALRALTQAKLLLVMIKSE